MYNKQGFIDGQRIRASHLNHMEEGILDASNGYISIEQTSESTEDGGENVIKATRADGTSDSIVIRNGSKGSAGPKGDKGDPGDASLPKPIPYEYMPEGYPKDNSFAVENKYYEEGDVAASSGMFVKVSGQTIPVEKLPSLILEVQDGTSLSLPADTWMASDDKGVMIGAEGLCAIAYIDNATFGEFTFPEKGFYLLPMQDGFVNVVSAHLDDITPIDYKFMPEGYPKAEMGTVTVLEEQTLTINPGPLEGTYNAQLPVFAVEVGKTYNVVYGGVTYVCEGLALQEVAPEYGFEGVLLGNTSMMGAPLPGSNNDAPFVAMCSSVLGIYSVTFSAAAQTDNPTFAIYEKAEVITPIAHKFLPEGYPWSEMQTVTVYEGVDVAFTQDGDLYYVNFAPEETINIGDKVTVVWDGEEYKDLIAFEFDGVVQVGAHPEAIKEDMPFNIYNPTHGVMGFISTISAASTHSVKIVMDVKSVTPLDAEFISLSPLYINWERVDDETVYSAPIHFSEALNMAPNTLMARLRLGDSHFHSSSCVGLEMIQTNTWGQHIIMKFVEFSATSSKVVTEKVTYLIWTKNSIRELTTS